MAERAGSPKVRISSRQHAMRVPRKSLAELIALVSRREGARVAEVDVAVVDRGRIARLNRRWLGRAGATDVISFDLSDGGEGPLVAQLVVCGDVAVSQARRRGEGVQRELMLYVVHGLLHLMGYDDRTPRRARRMRGRQEELLAEFLQGRR